MIDRQAEWLAAWRALANRLVEWERACREQWKGADRALRRLKKLLNSN